MPRPARRPAGPVRARKSRVVIPGVYAKLTAKLIADARAAVEEGDPRAVLIEDPDEAERFRHDPRGVIVGPALKALAAAERGGPVIVPRSMMMAETQDDVPMFGRDVRRYIVTPDDRVRPTDD
jgi:hypothetical protein